jgi:hypothetical protein
MLRTFLSVAVGALAVAGCQTPPPEHVGAPTPLLVEETPREQERKLFPKSEMKARYQVRRKDSCGSHCVYARQGDAHLFLDLRDDGSASALDEGIVRETFNSHNTATDQRTEWKRTWRGAWKGARGNVTVQLTPQEAHCRRMDQNGTTDLECRPVNITLECGAVDVVLEEDTPSIETSWVCEVSGTTPSEGMTPFPWVFALDRQLVARDTGSTQEPTRRYRLDRDGAEPRRQLHANDARTTMR